MDFVFYVCNLFHANYHKKYYNLNFAIIRASKVTIIDDGLHLDIVK